MKLFINTVMKRIYVFNIVAWNYRKKWFATTFSYFVVHFLLPLRRWLGVLTEKADLKKDGCEDLQVKKQIVTAKVDFHWRVIGYARRF